MGTFRPYTYALFLIPVLSFCQSSGSDSEILSNIQSVSSSTDSPWTVADVDLVIRRLDAIEDFSDDIASDTSSINEFVLKIDSELDKHSIFLDDISHDTGDILSKLSNLSYTVKKEVRVSDTGLLFKASSIDLKMDRLESAINNLTNYMCYSPEYTSAFNSNMLHLATSFFGYAWPFTNNENLSASITEQLQNVDGLIETGNYVDLNRYYGLWKSFPLMLYSILDYGHIPQGRFSHLRNAFNMFGIGSLVLHTNSLQQIGAPIYYQYGTRELTDSFELLTNTLLRVGSDIDFDSQALFTSRSRVASVSAVSDVPTLGFADATTNTFFSIANSALPSVTYDSSLGTNTPGYHDFSAAVLESAENYSYVPSTNNITPLEWDSFSSYKTEVENQTPNHPDAFSGFWNDSEKLPIVDEVTSWDSQSTDFILPFDLPFRFLSSHNTSTRNLVVHNATSYTRPYITFFVALIKVIIATFFINRIYNFILKTVAAVEES